MYDSAEDTMKHIRRVQDLMAWAAAELMVRARRHDQSKLQAPEKPVFDEFTPKLKTVEYASPEYKACLDQMSAALSHHYANNSHHPEHYPEGIDGMDLFDIIEMLIDWRAAGERSPNGSLLASIALNRGRFRISNQLENIFKNTANRYEMLKPSNEVIKPQKED